ncbi:MAG: hypothetical protein U5M23_12270 [Marinagarivorans sp.]|nr:hypothetical protein [Marinagarivorans sp.]
MKVVFSVPVILLLVGWILAGCASTALIVQHLKWTQQQNRWQQVLVEQVQKLSDQEQKMVELETIIADLHSDKDRQESVRIEPRRVPSQPTPPVETDPAEKAGEAISTAVDRFRSIFKRRPAE